jgi:hypothetical protein
LDDYAPVDSAMLREKCVVHDVEPMVRPHITVGCAATEGCAFAAYTRGH